jgi:hypothetical protein
VHGFRCGASRRGSGVLDSGHLALWFQVVDL